MIRTALVLAVFALAGCTASPSPLDPLLGKADAATAAIDPSQRTLVLSAAAAAPSIAWFPSPSGCMRGADSGSYLVDPRLVEGDRILSLSLDVTAGSDPFGTFALTVASRGRRPSGALLLNPMGSLDILDASTTAPTDYTLDLVDTVVSDGTSYWFEISASAPGACVGALRLTYDHPTP